MFTGTEPTVYPHPLAYVRAVNGWSASDCLREINATAVAEFGISIGRHDRNKVYRWEHNGVVPDPITQRALAHRLRVPAGRLLSDPWPRWLPAFHQTNGDYPSSQQGSIKATEDALGGDAMDRRDFLALTGTALAAAGQDWLRREPDRLTASLSGDIAVDRDLVSSLEQQTALLRRLDDRIGGDTLGAAAHGQLRLAVDLLRNGRYTAEVGLSLQRAVAGLAQFTGWVAFDSGRHALAQRYYQAALRAAHPAKDRPLGGLVLACMSYQAASASQPKEAVPLAEAAVSGSRDAGGPRTIGLLTSRLAFAHAANGPAEASAAALDAAATALDTANDRDDPSWAYWFNHSSLVGFRGRCFMLLGRGDLAEPLLASSADELGTTYVRDRALRLTRLADARLLAGDADHACQTAQRAADALTDAASHRSIAGLRRLHDRLMATAGAAAVDDLGHRLADLRAAV